MSTPPPDRRRQKRLATREHISDIATQLFTERGFDNVTVDEVAAAADVGRMTVFNHFPRKEDLFFDRDEEIRHALRDAIQHRDARTSPFEALRRLAHRLVQEDSPYVEFSTASQGFAATIEASETLKARARSIRDELARTCADALTAEAGQPADDPVAVLAAAVLLATWSTAALTGHAHFRQHGDEPAAAEAFLGVIDRGTLGIEAMLAGTPYGVRHQGRRPP